MLSTYSSTAAGRADRQMRQELVKINAAVSENCANLAPYQFLTAFSQLISRVCHSSDEVFTVLMTIVAKVFLAYPQQAMWLMTAVSKVGACVCMYLFLSPQNTLYALLTVCFVVSCSVFLPDAHESLQSDPQESHQSQTFSGEVHRRCQQADGQAAGALQQAGTHTHTHT